MVRIVSGSFFSFLGCINLFFSSCSRFFELVLVSLRLSMFSACFRFNQLLWVVAGFQGRVLFEVFFCCCKLLDVVSVVLSF